MSSDSEEDRSSSSDKNEDNQDNRSRSRSREKRKSKRSDERAGKTITIKIPELSGYLVPFSSFMKNQTDKVNPDRLKKAYSKYKSDWEAKQNEIFLLEHMGDAWFCEKYDPEMKDQNERDHNAMIKGQADKFFNDLKNGRYNTLNLTTTEQALTVLGEVEDTGETSNNSIDIVVKENINIEQSPYFGMDIDKLTLFVKPISTNIYKNDIKEVVSKLPGFVSVHMSEPIKKQNFIRYCWVVFESEETFSNAAAVLNGLCIKNTELSVSKSSSKSRRLRGLKHYPKSRVGIDCRTSYALIKTLDEQEGVEGNPLIEQKVVEDETHLDLYLLYLRRVHGYDYFTSQQFVDERSLTNKIGMAHLRLQSDVEQQYDIPTILKKNQQEAEKRAEHPREKKQAKDQIIKLFDDDIEIIGDKEAWKCRSCPKKFMASEFLLKHYLSKHPEDFKKFTDKIAERSYLHDDNKITSYPQPPGKDDFRNDYGDRGNRGRRGNYGGRGQRRFHYQDLDDPNAGKDQDSQQKGGRRALINFLDI